jgi:hypothetical protein
LTKKQLIYEVEDLEADLDNLVTRLDNIETDIDDDIGRMSYIRQLTAEFLEYIKTLNDELKGQVEIPKSDELMYKIINRPERKRYYMSKFRL